MNNVEIARRYLAAIESGADFEELAAFLTEDVVQEEFPNRITPTTARRDLAAMREASVRGRKVMTSQRYEVLNVVAKETPSRSRCSGAARSPFPSDRSPRAGRCARGSR